MAQTSLPVSLTAKLTKSDSRLELLYSITNNGKTPILVFNRLWRGASGDEPDDEKIYRFVVSRSLRLLLGDAPLPHNPVALRYFPEATRVAPFASLDERITVAIPVTEYNVYFSMTSREQWAADKVDNAELFVRYVDISGGAQTVPSTVHSGAETIVNAEGLLHHKTLRSGPLPISLDVLRQTGEYSRLDLP